MNDGDGCSILVLSFFLDQMDDLQSMRYYYLIVPQQLHGCTGYWSIVLQMKALFSGSVTL